MSGRWSKPPDILTADEQLEVDAIKARAKAVRAEKKARLPSDGRDMRQARAEEKPE